MRRDIRRTITCRHPVDRVWRALTDPAALAVWLMRNDFRPEVGHEFTFVTNSAPGFDGIVHCRVLDLDEPRLMRLSWRGGPVDATVTWRLSPLPLGTATGTIDGTRLDFAMEGFEGYAAVLTSYLLGAGLRGMYARDLPAVLDRIAAGSSYGEPRTVRARRSRSSRSTS